MNRARASTVFYIIFILMTSIGFINTSKDEETHFWSEVDMLYGRSEIDKSTLVNSFDQDKLLKHFYHCSDQTIKSELCVNVLNSVTQGLLKKGRKWEFKKLMSSDLSIKNREVKLTNLCSPGPKSLFQKPNYCCPDG